MSDDHKFDFFDFVTIGSDESSWGQSPRDEIIGKEGVVFGITYQAPHVKCEVYIRELDRTYGVAAKNLRALGKRATERDYIREFSEGFFELFAYGLIFPMKPEDFPAFREKVRQFESAYPRHAIALFSEHAIAHIDDLRAKLSYAVNNADATLVDYVRRYRQALLDEAANAQDPRSSVA